MGIAAGHRKHEFHSLSANQLPPAVATLNHHSKCGCCVLLTRFPHRTFFSSSSFLSLNSADTSASGSNHHPPPKGSFWCLFDIFSLHSFLCLLSLSLRLSFALSFCLNVSFFSFTFVNFRLSLPALLFFPPALGVFSQVFVWGGFACSVDIQPAESKPAGRSKTGPVK